MLCVVHTRFRNVTIDRTRRASADGSAKSDAGSIPYSGVRRKRTSSGGHAFCILLEILPACRSLYIQDRETLLVPCRICDLPRFRSHTVGPLNHFPVVAVRRCRCSISRHLFIWPEDVRDSSRSGCAFQVCTRFSSRLQCG